MLLRTDQAFLSVYSILFTLYASLPDVDSDSSNTCCLPRRSLKTLTPDLKLLPDFFFAFPNEEKKETTMISKHLAANLTNNLIDSQSVCSYKNQYVRLCVSVCVRALVYRG